MSNFTDFLYGTANQAAGAGMGLLLGRWNDQRQLEQQERLQNQQIRGQKQMVDYGMLKQLEMWEKTGFGGQIAQMKKHGINPGLLYGMSGAGGATTGSASGNVSGGNAPVGGGEIPAMMGMGIQYQLLKAQKENIEADTANKRADTTGKGITQAGQLTDNETKIIDNIIRAQQRDMQQMDWEDYYEPEHYFDEEGNRVYTQDNLTRQARREKAKAEFMKGKAEAELYVQLYKDGTLQKMTQAELDAKLADIGVKAGTIDKIKLENALTEMEKKWQEKLGMGKDSKGWVDNITNILMRILLHFTRGAGTNK